MSRLVFPQITNMSLTKNDRQNTGDAAKPGRISAHNISYFFLSKVFNLLASGSGDGVRSADAEYPVVDVVGVQRLVEELRHSVT